MFKVGEYYEDEAKIVAAYLKDAGLKVDVKGLVVARTEYLACIQGKLSELKVKLAEVEEMPELIETDERYLAALKATLEKGAVDETFRDIYLNELIPGWNETLDKIQVLKEAPEEIDEKTRDDIFSTMAECVMSIDFAEKVIELNELEFGSPVGNLLDDPVVSLSVDPNDFDPNEPMIFQRMEVNLEKKYEIAIDEFSASLFDKIDDEFQEEFAEEFLAIRSVGLVVMSIINASEKGKMDIEDFADLCNFESGDRWHMSIDGSMVAEEIARSFEKAGMLKMKGSTIKWKG